MPPNRQQFDAARAAWARNNPDWIVIGTQGQRLDNNPNGRQTWAEMFPTD